MVIMVHEPSMTNTQQGQFFSLWSFIQGLFFQKNTSLASLGEKKTLHKEDNALVQKNIWVFIGLGNPGKDYEKTRHNAGILLIEGLKEFWEFPEFRQKAQVKWTQGMVEGQKVILAYPMAYMNVSGQALASFVRLYPQAQWVVCHDELDLPPGDIRFKEGGGHGGHNGLRSLEGILKNPYKRLRLGIGRPEEKHQVSHYVLNNFSKEQWENLQKSAENLVSLLPLLIKGEKNLFIQKLHEKKISQKTPG